MKKPAIAFAICFLSALPLFARGKDIRDATLVKATLERPTKADAMQGLREGYTPLKTWWFDFRVGDLDYYAYGKKGLAKEGEWQDNTPVKVWFEVKGGAVATRTWVHLLNEKGKDIELEVGDIYDAAGHDYCGIRKCDPESAEKKARGEK